MKKINSYILPILFFASFVFNFSTSNAMHLDNIPLRLEIPEESCRSLLLLGTGIAGLILITGTIRHIINTINTEKETHHNIETLLTSLLTRRHGLGIGTGILLLATGFWGLNSRFNFPQLFGSKTSISSPQKPEEK